MLRSLLNQVTVLASFSVDAADMESWNVLAAALNESTSITCKNMTRTRITFQTAYLDVQIHQAKQDTKVRIIWGDGFYELGTQVL